MRLMYAIALLLLPVISFADVYKCTDEGGNTVFSQTPCGEDAEEVEIEERNKAPKNKYEEWKAYSEIDEFDGHKKCYVTSPPDYLYPGKSYHNSMVVQVVIMADDFQFRTDEIFDHDAKRFAINAGGQIFHAQSRPNAKIISFGMESEKIISKIMSMNDGEVQANIYNWPYNEFPELANFTTKGFSEAMSKYEECKAEL